MFLDEKIGLIGHDLRVWDCEIRGRWSVLSFMTKVGYIWQIPAGSCKIAAYMWRKWYYLTFLKKDQVINVLSMTSQKTI